MVVDFITYYALLKAIPDIGKLTLVVGDDNAEPWFDKIEALAVIDKSLKTSIWECIRIWYRNYLFV